jgi:glucuronoarabinoxylan endo-1,4-beta-xylanase
MVQLGQTQQTMEGFGISNIWAAALTDTDADALFGTAGNGIGLSILRIGMDSNGGHMNSSSLQDIAKAKARGVPTIIGTLYSPPANCKTNNSVNDGGHLLTSCYESWSTAIAKFAKDNFLYAMSPQNEPDFASCGTAEPCNGSYPSTLYTDAEMVAFIKLVGPKLKAAGVKVIAPEPSQWLRAWTNGSACCSEPGAKPSPNALLGQGYDYGHALSSDAAAWAALDIVGVHQYYSQVAEPWPTDVSDRKPVWMTEMSGLKWWPEQGPSSTISNGVVVAGWIHNALTVGQASAWLWWWYKGTTTNEGLLNNGADTKRRYTLGNYSKFIRPGYVRVDVAGTIPTDVLLSAYKGADGTVVVVAINKGSASATVPVTLAGGTAPAAVTPWVTSATDNLIAKSAVAVTGGSFTAALAGQSVTTFVGK